MAAFTGSDRFERDDAHARECCRCGLDVAVKREVQHHEVFARRPLFKGAGEHGSVDRVRAAAGRGNDDGGLRECRFEVLGRYRQRAV